MSERRSSENEAPFWLRPTSYWMPSHYPLSAWFTHAPFAAWLTDVVRPDGIIELGTHKGFSCFVFAEALARLGVASTVSGLDSWEGDDHAGFYGEEVYQGVDAIVREHYPRSVELVRGYFNDSRPRFGDGVADLLHIDGRHGYDDAREDYEQWRSVVRDGGVILFHDIAERENGFGVWQLWDELFEPGRAFAFEHGHGLGVLAVGEIRHEPLRALFDADAATAAVIRADFSRLGDHVHRQAWLESLPHELDRETALAHERALLVNELSAQISEQRARNDALTSSTSWRVTAPLRAVGRLRPPRG